MTGRIKDIPIPDTVPTMGEAAWYRIQVAGKMDKSWSDRLGGLEIAVTGRVGKDTITTLSGQVPDQCALAGVLSLLYDHHFPILALKYVANSNDNKEGRGCDGKYRE